MHNQVSREVARLLRNPSLILVFRNSLESRGLTSPLESWVSSHTCWWTAPKLVCFFRAGQRAVGRSPDSILPKLKSDHLCPNSAFLPNSTRHTLQIWAF